MVDKLLKQLDPNKSPRPDAVHPAVLKELADTLAEPLRVIFETSLRTGWLPKIWKTAHVTAIYMKGGGEKKPANYRPVSLTAVPCKILEKLVREWMVNHLQSQHTQQ